MIWKMFVENFNGTSFILDDTWLSDFDMQLFTDSAGGMEPQQMYYSWRFR
jgi:hypothetical protein